MSSGFRGKNNFVSTLYGSRVKMYVQFWTVGGARGFELEILKLFLITMRLSTFHVQNFITFLHMVLWAAKDFHGGRRIMRRRKRRRRKSRRKLTDAMERLRDDVMFVG